MRSIATEDDELDGHIGLTPELEGLQDCPAGAIALTAPADPLASAVDAVTLIREATAVLADDETAQMLFEGTVDGMDGKELREFLGLGQKEFNTKRRFVRRRLNEHFGGKRS
jgi:hypothetical protein